MYINVYRCDRLLEFCATPAIINMDRLPKLVVKYIKRNHRPPHELNDETNKFRNELAIREPAVEMIHETRQIFKREKSHKFIKPPYTNGLFYGDLSESQIIMVHLNDGTEIDIFELLIQARQAWGREFNRLNL